MGLRKGHSCSVSALQVGYCQAEPSVGILLSLGPWLDKTQVAACVPQPDS